MAYCPNCGKYVDDNAKFCDSCGAAMIPQQNPYLNSPSQQNPYLSASAPGPQYAVNASQPSYVTPAPVKKKKRVLPVILSILGGVLAIAIIAAGLFMTKPELFGLEGLTLTGSDGYTVDTFNAIKEANPEKAVKAALLDAFIMAKDLYTEGKFDYNDLELFGEALESGVLKRDKAFKPVFDELHEIEKSRRAFNKAEEYYASGEYADALPLYREVKQSDTLNYDTAQDRLKECSKALAKGEIEGLWLLELDISSALKEYNIQGPVYADVYFTFSDDGTGSIFCSMENVIDKIMPDLIEIAYDELMNTTGLSRSEINTFLPYMGYASMEDFVREMIKPYLYDDMMNDINESFVYTYDGNGLIVDGTEYDILIDGDNMTVNTPFDMEGFGNFGMFNPPYYLIRTYG